MTTANPFDTSGDPAQQFMGQLPLRMRHQLHHTARVTLYVRRAIELGWTVDALVHECTRDHNGAANAGALITFRLEKCAGLPPPDDGKPAKVHDGCCDNGFIYNEDVDPVEIIKCPGKAAT